VTKTQHQFVPGLAGVPAAKSAISYVDGSKGILEYRGIPIESLAERSNFEEICWLLLTGAMPTDDQLRGFRSHLVRHRMLPDKLVTIIEAMPGRGHPMDALQASMAALGMFAKKPDFRDPGEVDEACARILGATAAMVAAFDRLRNGKNLVAQDPELNTAANFLHLLKGEPPDELSASIFDVALILHADHTMNASTFAARVVASTEADPYTVCSSAIGALHGPLHGGANERVLTQLEEIASPENVCAWLDAKQASGGKVMGFGHRVYKVKDPRATILQAMATRIFDAQGHTPIYSTALELERQMKERYGDKGIYPNVDFFSGFVYSKLGIPTDLFTPVFAISRVAGYLSHWREQMQDNKIFRPRQVYVGDHDLTYPDLGSRK
jgi:citrate synthase